MSKQIIFRNMIEPDLYYYLLLDLPARVDGAWAGPAWVVGLVQNATGLGRWGGGWG